MINFGIDIKNICKSFGKTCALKNFSIDFKPSSMHVIVGPEGAGKTTLLRILAGLLIPDAGEFSYYNHGLNQY